MFSKSTYVSRRNRLKEDLDSGILLFLGNEEVGMNYKDNTYHYRQDSSFLYFFGLDNPGLSAIIDLDEDKEIIFADELSIDDIVWMGTLPTIKSQAEKVGVEQTQCVSRLSEYLLKAEAKGRKVHFLPAYRPEHSIKLFDLLSIKPREVAANVSIEFVKAVINQRNYKSQEEIVQIEYAVNTTVDMHLAAMRMIRPGMRESDIAGAVQNIAMSEGGNLSFPTIATINGQTLHNHSYDNVLKDGDLFLLDCGAENKMHYAGDMSSTIPVSKTFTQRQKDIYQVALNAHQAGISALRPGVKFKDVHIKASRELAQGMADMGFMKGDLDEAVAQGAHALFFPCGLGHMMGLDVHDMENMGEQYVGYNGEAKSTMFGLKSLRLGRELEENFVLTIEPGVYFIPDLIDMWKAEKRFEQFINYDMVEKYKDFGGTRNEEDYLITKDGARLLGKKLPKTIADVENER